MINLNLGEYYVWYCDWCDSTNQVHWSSLNRNEPVCAACRRPRSDADVEMYGLRSRAA